MDFSPLTLTIWNANGLTQKFEEFKDFMEENDIDIGLVSETHAKPCHKLKIQNYDTYKTDRIHHRGGGTAIFTKRALTTSLVTSDNSNGMEYTEIIIEFKNRSPVHFISIYNPPNNKLTDLNVNKLFPAGKDIILAGDLNAKNSIWGCNYTNYNGKIIAKCLKNNAKLRVIAPTQPTHFPIQSYRPDILDIMMSNNSIPIAIDVVNELSSDHLPLISVIGLQKEVEDNLRKKINWEQVKELLSNNNENTTEIDSVDNVEERINKVSHEIINAVENSTTLQTLKDGYVKLPQSIKQLIKQRNWIRKRFQKTQDPHLQTELYNLNILIKNNSKNYRNEVWEEKVQSLCTEDNSIWKMSRALKRDKITNKPLHGENGLVYTEKEKAEALADTLEKQFTNNLEPCDDDHEETVEVTVEQLK